MTPLAMQLSKILTTRKANTDEFWRVNRDNLRATLDDTHFFEVTEILPMIEDMKNIKHDKLESALGTLGFLPAPKTWLEFYSPICRHRAALYLEEIDHTISKVHLVWPDGAQLLGRLIADTCDCITDGGNYYLPIPIVNHLKSQGHDAGQFAMSTIGYAHHILSIINSPHIIGRKQHMPHRGLERRLIKEFGVGKFPLHAWTEIKLHVAKPIEIDDGLPHEAHLTGRRALHFCRKHIRVRLGKLEYVSAHWRGDPAIGIKQSRYKACA